MGRAERLGRAFDRGPRAAGVLLWVAGAGIAGWSAATAISRGHWGQAAVYLVVAAALAALGLALGARWRPAEILTAAGLAGSLPGALAATAELVAGVDAAKAAEIRSLGVDPRFGVELNIAYFLVGSAIGAWLAWRYRAA